MGDRHHYLPQFYLRHWCEDSGALWCFPTSGEKAIHSNPRPFAAERGLYDAPDDSLMSSLDHEGDLAKIEGLHASVWPGIFERIASLETKRNLASFIALLYLRHPDMRQMLGAINNRFSELVDGLPSEQEILFENRQGKRVSTAGDVRKGIYKHDGDLQVAFIRQMRSGVKFLAKVLADRKWGILKSEGPIFLTGDRPIVLCRGSCTKERFGLRTPGTQITFPVSPRHMLVIQDDWEADRLIYPLFNVKNLNDGVIQVAERFVFGFRADSKLPEIIKGIRRQT